MYPNNYVGDHIRRLEGVYDHHMLVVQVLDESHLRVIHYTTTDDYVDGKSNDSSLVAVASTGTSSGASAGEVRENIIEVDLAQEKIEKLEYPPGVAKYTGREAIKRARTRLGETGYSLLFNNCESLVNWAITVKNATNQGDAGVVAGGLLTAGVTGAVGYGLYSVFSGRKTDNK